MGWLKIICGLCIVILLSSFVSGIGYNLYTERGMGEPLFVDGTNKTSGLPSGITNHGWTNSANCASSAIQGVTLLNFSSSLQVDNANDQECLYTFPYAIDFEVSGRFQVQYPSLAGDHYAGFGNSAAPVYTAYIGASTSDEFTLTEGYALSFGTGKTGVTGTTYTVYFHYSPSNFFNLSMNNSDWTADTGGVAASLGEFYIWENNGNGFFLDTFEMWNGTPNNDPKISLGDSQSPLAAFLNQTPVNISLSNVMNSNLTSWFNFTDETQIDNDTAVWQYKTNTSSEDFAVYINGTPLLGFQKINQTSNNEDFFRFDIDDIIYPGTYNLDHEIFEDTPHLDTELTGLSTMAKAEVLNMTRDVNITFIEVMVNSTDLGGGLDFFYCNASYSTGLVSINSNCQEFFTLDPLLPFNHTHNVYSSHHIVPMVIQNGSVGSVFVSSLSQIVMRPSTGGLDWEVSYVPNKSREDAFQTSTNGGTTWSSQSGTIDMHVHQYNLTDKLHTFACINDSSANEGCTAVNSQSFIGVSLPPSTPVVLQPTIGLKNNNITINYTKSFSPSSSIDHYNISLNTPAGVNVQTIKSTNGVFLNATFDTTTIADGNYTVRVTAVDTEGLSSFDFSPEFEVDNTDPTLTITSPLNNQQYTNDSTRFSFICSDPNLFGYDVRIYNASETIHVNYTRNVSTTVFQWNFTFNVSNYTDGTYTFAASCLDGHTAKLIPDRSVSYDSYKLTVGDFSIESDVQSIIEYSKLSDRYTYNFRTISDMKHEFDITSTNKIYYLPDSRYKGHFVSGNQWLDTEPYTPEDVLRVSDYHYIVYLTGQDFNFRSIGDLNNITQENNFIIFRDNVISVNWTPYNPTNNTLFFNQTGLNFTFNYSNNRDNNSLCTLYRNGSNITTVDLPRGIQNITDTTISQSFTGTYDYHLSCFAYDQQQTRNTTHKIIRFQNSEFFRPPLTTAEVLRLTILFFIVAFFFLVHFFLIAIGFMFRTVQFAFIGGVFGVLASLVGVVTLWQLLNPVGIAFFVAYTMASTMFLFGLRKEDD